MKPTHAQAHFYLGFVEAAYSMYRDNPTDLTPPAQGFPDTDYVIGAYMTSTDPASGQQVFFGFVAFAPGSRTKPAIIAIRGTANDYEWVTDFDAVPVPFAPFPGSYVEKGFDEFFNDIVWLAPTGAKMTLAATAKKLFTPQMIVTGHSLGGAMATLLVARTFSLNPKSKMTLVTAASPPVGDASFVAQFAAAVGPNSWRYLNDLDGVAQALEVFYDQVDTRISLFSYDIWPTLACEHALLTYLWLLSPSGTPCTSDCCVDKNATKQRLKAVVEPKRAARAKARDAAEAALRRPPAKAKRVEDLRG
jgi:hypothetical protein